MAKEGGNGGKRKREEEEMSERKRKRIENKVRKLDAYVRLVESNIKEARRSFQMPPLLGQTTRTGRTPVQPTTKAKQKKVRLPSQPEKKEEESSCLTSYTRPSDEEFAKLKKRKREIDKLKRQWPKMFLNYLGEASSLTVEAEKRAPLLMTDIQNALVYSIIHNRASRTPRWAGMLHTRKFSHVVTVLVEGLSLSDVMSASHLPQEPEKGVENAQSEAGEGKVKSEGVTDKGNEGVSRERNTKTYNQPAWLADVLPYTCSSTQFKVEIIAPAKYDVQACEELTNVPLTYTKKKLIERRCDGINNALEDGIVRKAYRAIFPVRTKGQPIKHKESVSDTFDRRQLLLSIEDMFEFGYPLAVRGSPGFNDPEFTFTSDNYDQVTSTSPMFGVDCEMCMTVRRELELTSISVVNERHKLIYHKLVKPDYKIINYLTQFSGITPAMLANVTTRLPDVHKDLKKLLPPDAILVGHSLNSDLKAMKMMHPYVIDSSLVYNITNQRQKRTSLKRLTEYFIGEKIQTSHAGHDPTEDAAASLRLVQLKLKHDIKFGDVIQGWDGGFIKDKDLEDEDIQAYKQCTEQVMDAGDVLVTSLFAHGAFVKMAMLTTTDCVEQYSSIMTTLSQKVSHMEVLSGNKELSKKVAEVAITKDFTFAHIKMDRKLSNCTSVETRRHQLKKLDKQLARIHKASAAKAFMIFVFSGSTTDVPTDLCSNGFAMMGIKDIPNSFSDLLPKQL